MILPMHPRSIRALLFLVPLLAFVTTCERQPEVLPALDWDPLRPTVFARDVVTLLPARPWQGGAEFEQWQLIRTSDIVLSIRTAPEQPDLFDARGAINRELIVSLVPADSEPGLEARVGFALAGETLEPAVNEKGALQVSVPAGSLLPGAHFLTVFPKGLTDESGLAFERLELHTRAGEASQAERIQSLSSPTSGALLSIADLLSHGVSYEWHGTNANGALVQGSRSLRLAIPSSAQTGPFTFRVSPHNRSGLPARFSIIPEPDPTEQGSDAELPEHAISQLVEPGETGTLRANLPEGTLSLRLEIQPVGGNSEEHEQAAEFGLFFWRAPFFASAASNPQRTRKPTLVLITLDTFRKDLLESDTARPDGFAQPLEPTAVGFVPALTQGNADSTTFERAFTTSPWTLPSHASIFTGLYPSKHGAGVTHESLQPNVPTLGQHLAAAGYFNIGLAGGPFCHSTRGLARGFHLWENPHGNETSASDLTDRALEFLGQTSGDDPVFLFLNYFDAHYPYQPPEDLASLGLSETAQAFLRGEGLALEAVSSGSYGVPEHEASVFREAYRREVAEIDRNLDRLFEHLKSLGRFDEALIAVTTDHGELLGEGDLWGHGHRLDPELISAPMIIKWPASWSIDTKKESAPVTITDLFPTLLEAAGLELPEPVDGQSLLKVDQTRSHVVAEEHLAPLHPLRGELYVSDHQIGRFGRRSRDLRSTDAVSCWSRSNTSWSTAPCASSLTPLTAAEIPQVVGPLPGQGTLSDAEREALEALGYVSPEE